MLKLKSNLMQAVSFALCVALAHPLPGLAESAGTAPHRAVLGSVTSRGMVRIGEVQVPGTGTLFSGDLVRTAAGNALVLYEAGPRVILGNDSQASFSPGRVELQKGQMSFSANNGSPSFAASTLRIEPASAKSAANVTLLDHKATVSVTEGSLKVVDPSGVQLALLRAGEARLFEEASAALPSPAAPPAAAPAAAPPAPAPQGGGSSMSRAWLLALGIGIVGTSLGIAGLVRANDADDRADQANAAASQAQTQSDALRAQITALQATNTALTTQVRTLQAQLTSLIQQSGQQSQAIQGLTADLAELSRLEAQLNSSQVQLSQLLADIARQGGTATPAQLSLLQSLGGQLSSLFQAVQNATNRVADAAQNIRPIVISPTRLP